MKAQEEFNSMLLMAGNYERIKEIQVKGYAAGGVVNISEVPEPLVPFFINKILEFVEEEKLKAFDLMERTAEEYVKAVNSIDALAEAINDE